MRTRAERLADVETVLLIAKRTVDHCESWLRVVREHGDTPMSRRYLLDIQRIDHADLRYILSVIKRELRDLQ